VTPIFLGPIILKMAGDTLLVMISYDPKCQGHPDMFGWKYIEEH